MYTSPPSLSITFIAMDNVRKNLRRPQRSVHVLVQFRGEVPHGQLKGMTAVDIYHAIEQDDLTKEGSNNH